MSPLGFEPTILVRERPQTHALDRSATGIGLIGLASQILCLLLNPKGFYSVHKSLSMVRISSQINPIITLR
jgi:hypothetical protein